VMEAGNDIRKTFNWWKKLPEMEVMNIQYV
jgi:hypothetical protein